jgi:hypothetical protein
MCLDVNASNHLDDRAWSKVPGFTVAGAERYVHNTDQQGPTRDSLVRSPARVRRMLRQRRIARRPETFT